jgi:dienelactone hydrolase
MKKKLCLIVGLIVVHLIPLNAQQTPQITRSGIGYLQYLPQGYHANSKKYPVVIALHGIMEKGTSSTDPKRVFNDLGKVAHVGLAKYVKQGKKYPFILISPQLKYSHGLWPPSLIMDVLNHVKKELRIDDKRIYLTGLSLGGFGVWKTAGEYPGVFAAIAPICAGGNALNKARDIAAANLPVWGFHGSADKIASYTITTKMIDAINTAPKKPKPLAKVTIFPRMTHNVWDRAYQQTDLLDWMLNCSKGSRSNSDDANSPPVADAGPDRTVDLPQDVINLKGTASDTDGKVEAYEWKKVSGGHMRMEGSSRETLKISEFSEGTLVFKLTVTDNDGASASDEVKVIVNASENEAPVVDAGSDQTIKLPTNSVTLEGKASDRDGKITAYKWKQVSGGNARLRDISSAALTVTDLRKGSYVFRLTATDNGDATASDEVRVTVQPSANTDPTVTAGPDHTITLPNHSLTIQGAASDDDGEIVVYQWTKLSGGFANMNGASGAELALSNLSEGTYSFRLTVKDNDGSLASDDVNVTVLKGSDDNQQPPSDDNKPPVVFAGRDRTLKLPEASISLEGTAEDEDGSIADYSWTQVSGSSVVLTDSQQQAARVSGLRAGAYVFRLTATDNNGASNSDEVAIYVTGGWEVNMHPADDNAENRRGDLPLGRLYPLGATSFPGTD